jgi:hypothetical protein
MDSNISGGLNMTVLLMLLSAGIGLVFATFFAWNRLLHIADRSDAGRHAWWHAVVSALLAISFFIMMFALGAWFSIARLKGAGWFPLV